MMMMMEIIMNPISVPKITADLGKVGKRKDLSSIPDNSEKDLSSIPDNSGMFLKSEKISFIPSNLGNLFTQIHVSGIPSNLVFLVT
jgi:hypothetical protein